jgi:HEAT repeat protein
MKINKMIMIKNNGSVDQSTMTAAFCPTVRWLAPKGRKFLAGGVSPRKIATLLLKALKGRKSIYCLALIVMGLVGCQGGGVNLTDSTPGYEQLRQQMRQVVFAAARSDDALLRSHAMESLADMGGLEAPGLIREGLHDSVSAVRFGAAVAAGDLKDHTSKHLLERLLFDKNDAVKLAAAYGLEKLGDDRFGNWYDGVLAGDDVPLTAQACMLLGKLGLTPLRTDSQDKLWMVLRKSGQDPVVKLQAAEALARLGDKRILEKLLAYAGSGYADDRLIAISGLEHLGGQQAYAMLTVLVDDLQLEVRLGALRALAEHATEEDIKLARDSMGYMDAQGDETATMRVRGLASLALGRVGEDRDAGLLYKAVNSKSKYISITAARAAIDFLRRRGQL